MNRETDALLLSMDGVRDYVAGLIVAKVFEQVIARDVSSRWSRR